MKAIEEAKKEIISQISKEIGSTEAYVGDDKVTGRAIDLALAKGIEIGKFRTDKHLRKYLERGQKKYNQLVIEASSLGGNLDKFKAQARKEERNRIRKDLLEKLHKKVRTSHPIEGNSPIRLMCLDGGWLSWFKAEETINQVCEEKKYKSCPVPRGEYCPKHGVVHKKKGAKK